MTDGKTPLAAYLVFSLGFPFALFLIVPGIVIAAATHNWYLTLGTALALSQVFGLYTWFAERGG